MSRYKLKEPGRKNIIPKRDDDMFYKKIGPLSDINDWFVWVRIELLVMPNKIIIVLRISFVFVGVTDWLSRTPTFFLGLVTDKNISEGVC